MAGKLVISFVTCVLSFLLTYLWRHFPMRLAVLGSLSIGVLTYSTLQASDRLRRMYRR